MSSFAELLDVLYEDNHIIALNKPNGWPTTHFDGNEETFDRLVKSYIKEKYQKPGNVFLGVVHRLDKATSGALVFARTSKAAARLSEQFRDGEVEKVYWAVVSEPAGKWGSVFTQILDEKQWGTLDDWLWHDDAGHIVKAVPEGTPDAKPARLHFQIKARHGGLMLLEVRPHTGRKHQIRVQLASRGMPIYGDTKYGSEIRFGNGLGLHARSLTFLHPTKHEPISLRAEIPKSWRGRFAYLLA